MGFFASGIIHYWLGNRIHVDSALLAGLACWAVVDSVGNSIAMFLNGASVIRPQVILAVVFAVCALAVKIGFVRRWGIDAMPWATLLAYLFLTALPYAIIVPRIVAKVCGTEPTGSAYDPSPQYQSTG